MNRAERRRAMKNNKAVTHNLTQEQISQIKQEAMDEAIEVAVTLMLSLPLEALKSKYWVKTAKRRLPKFMDDVLSLYDDWNKGLLTIEELRADLWEYGGIKLETPKGTERM